MTTLALVFFVGRAFLVQAGVVLLASVLVWSMSHTNPSDSRFIPELLRQFNAVCAALLGASFSGLLTAYTYIKTRTFDSQYIADYWIRCLIGLVAGVILANLGSGLIQEADGLSKLGPGIIALLGGYSAEAVRQVLDRLVEVLLTAVRGKDSTADQQRIDVARDLVSITADPQTPEPVRRQLQALIKGLRV